MCKTAGCYLGIMHSRFGEIHLTAEGGIRDPPAHEYLDARSRILRIVYALCKLPNLCTANSVPLSQKLVPRLPQRPSPPKFSSLIPSICQNRAVDSRCTMRTHQKPRGKRAGGGKTTDSTTLIQFQYARRA